MMKNLLFIFYLLSAFSLSAQLTFSETSTTTIDANEGAFEVVSHNTVTNSSTSTNSYTWLREQVSGPGEWDCAVCDKNTCYFPTVNTQTFQLTQGEESIMDLHVRPNSTAGCGEYKVTVTNDNDENDVAVATYFFEIGEVECLTSSTNVLDIRSIRIFPNPTFGLFQVSDSANKLTDITVYNIIGRPVMNFTANNAGAYDVSELAAGLYLVQLKEDNGRIVKTVRLQKS